MTPKEWADKWYEIFCNDYNRTPQEIVEQIVAEAIKAERATFAAALKRELAGFARFEMDERAIDPKGTGKQFNRYFGVVHFLDDVVGNFDSWLEDHEASE